MVLNLDDDWMKDSNDEECRDGDDDSSEIDLHAKL